MTTASPMICQVATDLEKSPRTSMPLVSVGLPTYNRSDVLMRAIVCVLAQSYEHLELVISDNASTDDTERLCRDACAQDTRVRYYRQPINRGATENFKAVLQLATGEYFMWLSDDDWLEPNYISSCVAHLLAHPDVVAVCGRAMEMRGDTCIFEEPPMYLRQEAPAARVLWYYWAVFHNGVFYSVMRKDAIQQVQMANRFGSDALVMAGMAFLGKLDAIPHTRLYKSIGGMSATEATTVEGLGLPKSLATNPWWKFSFSVFADIAWRNSAYRRAGVIQRWVLAARATDVIWNKMPMPSWWQGYRSMRNQFTRLLRPS
jgi:glycosyltransferase involved in cell wall biosynthesis